MQTIGAFFRHRHIGKSKQAEPYTAAAHARYIMGKEKAYARLSVGLIRHKDGSLNAFPINWHAIQRFLNEREDSIRRNGRVIDKFIAAVPQDMDEKAVKQLIRRFGKRIGAGRAPLVASLHREGNNHHAHIIFVDADPETGKRVFGTTELGSTAQLKDAWEGECNGLLAELGMDLRISFSTEIELPEELNQGEIIQLPDHSPDDGNMVADQFVQTDEMVSEQLPTDTECSDLQADPDLEEVSTILLSEEDHMPIFVQAVEDALDYDDEMQILHSLQTDRANIQGELEALLAKQAQDEELAQRDHHALIGAYNRKQAAEQAFQQQGTGLWGRLKGIRLKAFGVEWKSEGRRRAEELKAELEAQASEASARERGYKEWAVVREQTTKAVDTVKERLEAVRQQLMYTFTREGTDAELQSAEKAMVSMRQQNLNKVSPDVILHLHENGQITTQDARRTLYLMGEHEAAYRLEPEGVSLN